MKASSFSLWNEELGKFQWKMFCSEICRLKTQKACRREIYLSTQLIKQEFVENGLSDTIHCVIALETQTNTFLKFSIYLFNISSQLKIVYS